MPEEEKRECQIYPENLSSTSMEIWSGSVVMLMR